MGEISSGYRIEYVVKSEVKLLSGVGGGKKSNLYFLILFKTEKFYKENASVTKYLALNFSIRELPYCPSSVL